MAKYEVTIDGKPGVVDTAQLGLPEDATPEQIQAAIVKITGAKRNPGTAGLTGASASVFDSLLKGAADPVWGLGQIAARGMETVLPEGLGGGWARENRKLFEGLMKESEDEYQQKRGADAGFDTGRVIGSILSTIPLGGLGGAPGLVTRGINAAAKPILGQSLMREGAKAAPGLFKSGAILGGVGGAAMPVQDAGDDFALAKLAQTGVGAATGGVVSKGAGYLGEKAVGATKKLLSRAAARKAAAGPESIDAAAIRILGNVMGPDLANVGDDVRNAILKDVKGALETSGEVSPEAVRRLADFRMAGMNPTKAWVTADPVDWTRQQNLGAIEGAGESIMRAENAAANRYGQILSDMTPEGAATGQYAQGSVMARAAEKSQAAMDKYVDDLYERVQEVGRNDASGRSTLMRGSVGADGRPVQMVETLADPRALMTRIEDRLLQEADAWPGQFQKLFASYGPNNPLTFRELHRLYKVTNSKLANAGPDTNALRNIKQAIMEEMTRISEAGTEAHKAATQAARANYARQEISPVFAAAKKGNVLEEGFFDKYIGPSASYKSVERMWKSLSHDPDFVTQARAATVDRLLKAAYGTQDIATGKPALDRFAREINQKGMKEKLKLILPKEDYSKVLLLERLGQYMRAPAGERGNRSNTAGATASFAFRILKSLRRSDLVAGATDISLENAATRAASAAPEDVAVMADIKMLPPALREYAMRALAPALSPVGAEYYQNRGQSPQ